MVEITFENLYPLAGLIIISVTIWGMSRKFTSMDLTIANNQKSNERDMLDIRKDIDKLQSRADNMESEIKDISAKVNFLEQKGVYADEARTKIDQRFGEERQFFTQWLQRLEDKVGSFTMGK